MYKYSSDWFGFGFGYLIQFIITVEPCLQMIPQADVSPHLQNILEEVEIQGGFLFRSMVASGCGFI